MKIRRVPLKKLSEEEVELLAAAGAARTRARTLWSGYLVGAAVRSTPTGKIHIGCNIERIGEPTTCAERVAINAMAVAEDPGVKVAMLAVVAGPAGTEINCIERLPPVRWIGGLPVPCERCLRLIWEECGGNPDVVILGANIQEDGTLGKICRMRIGDLRSGSLSPKAK